jgi:hypothetical protein
VELGGLYGLIEISFKEPLVDCWLSLAYLVLKFISFMPQQGLLCTHHGLLLLTSGFGLSELQLPSNKPSATG